MDPHDSLHHASTLLARADSSGRPAVYKAVGISLAVASGVFIGISFVIKKIGLLKANVKYNEEAGEGYGYLKNAWWWLGMTLMIVGEICNFVAYAFVDAILVTPLGALSVVITTILSAIFLKERLSFVGKVGCFCCIIGSIVIAMNAPDQSSVSDIQAMQKFVIAPGFLTYAGVILVGAAITALWAGPRYGKKSMFVYISICSMVGGLSVVATQGLGSAILAQIDGEEQFKHWFLYVLFVFVVCTLLTEIIYLNKALNLFNAALVTPTYYVMFTSATIVTSAILFQGFKGTGIQIATVIMGFMQICAGVVLLQLSKSAKDVPDAAVFKGDLDQIREVATQEEPEYEPKADSIRGAASILRRISTTRREHEQDEARRFVNEKQEDFLKPPAENEIIEWDGIRRRKTVIGEGPTMSRPHTPRTPSVKQPLPPLGMSRFPDPEDENENRPSTKQSGHSFLGDIRSRTSSILQHGQWLPVHKEDEKSLSANIDTEMTNRKSAVDTEYYGAGGLEPPFRPGGRERSDTPRSISWADEKADEDRPQTHHALEPPYAARRQFSFNSMFNRRKAQSTPTSPKRTASPPRGILRRNHGIDGDKSATEEERLGLVRGDSRTADETLGEKLERWSSAESDAAEIQPMHRYPLPSGRAHGDSVSSMSTSAFPPYEDHHAFYAQSGNVSNPYYLPHARQATASPEHTDEHEGGWNAPRSRTRTNSSSHPRAPPPAQSSFSTHRHPNPLPPLPDNTPLTLDGGVRSASSESSDMGVASISSTEARDDDNTPAAGVTRQHSGWRRHMSETSSVEGESYETRSPPRGGSKGAFL
ncbi:uncharacterized protein N7496_008591 [Penicillium cataractarum]|uniref:Uncharacterized protein n=1 Tax=Penicillium cataractarum TaxID=2100454 RepID=A0A9W9V766_9EURO|nr:uncharacterized protein N7496_008591 [Penicillium cataractarum]KAJ5368831.1 hypothetical protein N7496_008591 [Penicillium cataractarum]